MSKFDGAAGEQLKMEGMQRAAENRAAILSKARDLAHNIARKSGYVTADDVYQALMFLGYREDCLGPAAGSLFKTPEFVATGQLIKSKRTSNHRRLIRVWRLKS